MPVYFMRAGGFGDVKIGFAKSPLSRMKQLQTSISTRLRLIRVLDATMDDERALHARFSHLRKSGEWFRFSQEMLASEIGFPDLDIPQTKRPAYGMDTTTARGRYLILVGDLLDEIGGTDVLARAVGVPPWTVHRYPMPKVLLGALVMLARQAGTDVSLRAPLIACEEAEREYARAAEEAAASQSSNVGLASAHTAREREWLKRHPRSAMWWEPFTPEPGEASAGTDVTQQFPGRVEAA